MVNILQKAGVRFAILGSEEGCTGDPARRLGNEYLYQTLAQQNVEILNRYKVKEIVTQCPHCFHTIKNEYPDLGGNYTVYHSSEYIDQLLRRDLVTPPAGQCSTNHLPRPLLLEPVQPALPSASLRAPDYSPAQTE